VLVVYTIDPEELLILSFHSNYFQCMVCGDGADGSFNQVCETAAPVSTPPSGECSNPPRDSCSFYADCLESRYHCTYTNYNYPIGYGQYFCQKILSNLSQFSSAGQTWALDTMQCLQSALIPEATGQVSTTCQALLAKAFGTHASCYINSGFCSLPCADWQMLESIIGLQTIFQNWDAFIQALETAVECPRLLAYVFFGVCS